MDPQIISSGLFLLLGSSRWVLPILNGLTLISSMVPSIHNPSSSGISIPVSISVSIWIIPGLIGMGLGYRYWQFSRSESSGWSRHLPWFRSSHRRGWGMISAYLTWEWNNLKSYARYS